MATPITPRDLQQALKRGDVTPVDVRRKATYEGAPDILPGAKWQDPEKVDAWFKELPREKPFVVYCVHGRQVSQGVADHLQELGFDARYLEGGIEGWREAGGEVEPKVL